MGSCSWYCQCCRCCRCHRCRRCCPARACPGPPPDCVQAIISAFVRRSIQINFLFVCLWVNNGDDFFNERSIIILGKNTQWIFQTVKNKIADKMSLEKTSALSSLLKAQKWVLPSWEPMTSNFMAWKLKRAQLPTENIIIKCYFVLLRSEYNTLSYGGGPEGYKQF